MTDSENQQNAKPGPASTGPTKNAAPILAIANQKGGVGKTTTTVSVAVALARRGARVLLVDLDPQGNATSSLGIDKNTLDGTTYDLILGEQNLASIVKASGRVGLDLVPTDSSLASAEVELVSVPDRERQLRRALEPARLSYDIVVIDCPPSLGLLTVNALTAAQSLLVPIQCEFLPLEGMAQLRATISQVQRHLNRGLVVAGVLMTMYDARTRLSAQVVEEVRRFYGPQMFTTIIPRTIRLAEAPSYGLAIMEYDARSNGAEAYTRLVEELIDRLDISVADASSDPRPS